MSITSTNDSQRRGSFFVFLIKRKKKIELTNALLKIKKELNKNHNNTSLVPLLPKEERLLHEIIQNTIRHNKNNLTRTKAYLDFYQRHPEIHWAFLGHMVSRNGGWNMTDLKGELLSKLVSKKEAIAFFTFLERGNWLIFQDAYPQFLVYEESMKRGQNLFHLLPHLHISSFMFTIWNHFWKDRNPYLLATALIINEQNYLEIRIINNQTFKKQVFETFEFKIQEILSMNHIIFPYLKNNQIILVGQTLNHFESLHERILLGKRLYSILFDHPDRLKQTLQWAITQPHTGSRKDYWPHLFNDVNEGLPGVEWKTRLKSCQIESSCPRFYSPRLPYAWKNSIHEKAEIKDWYTNWQVIKYLVDSKEKVDGEIKHDYCKTLEKLERAGIAKKTITFLN